MDRPYVTTTLSSELALSQYQRTAGRYDECRDTNGQIRPVWQVVGDELARLGPSGLTDRAFQIEQLIRESGATFNLDSEQDNQSRPWQLASVPIVFKESEWQILESGLAQRVRILEAILDDFLGPQRLIKSRVVPPELLWANPDFFRAYHNMPRTGAHRLHVTAADLARAEDGTWWVTGDRTRAPSGLGYLLENRIVLSRVFPKWHRTGNVKRLASFFASLQEHFQSLAAPTAGNPRVALLTPGQQSYRDFEDAYLARYLGYTLVQGRDLAVRGDRLNLKTLGGLLPIDVLWRHVSDRKCDPLELDPSSLQGVTGLVRAIRSGNVAVANAIGAAMVQMPALLPFLPAAARLLTGETLQLPSVATYWCGGERECRYVLENLDTLVVQNAFAITGSKPLVPAELTQSERADLIAKIRTNPEQFVGQQKIAHSVTPIWHEQQLRPWHVALRAFTLQTDHAIEVLPGALSRVSPSENLLGRSPTSGLLTQDCWIVSDKLVDSDTTLLPDAHQPLKLRRSGAELPSRVAEHLFWLGRYTERCESIARLLRTTLMRLAGEESMTEMPEMPRLVAALAAIGQLEPDYAISGLGDSMPRLDVVLPASVFESDTPRGLQAAAISGMHNATAVRDRISLDAYRIFGQIHSNLVESQPSPPHDVPRAIERLNRLITHLLAFSGLTAESMTRTHGWRFMLLGRRIERADSTAELLMATLTEPLADETRLCEALLDATDSIMTYRSRYLTLVRPEPAIDLLVTDVSNPRSLRFQCQEIRTLLSQLPTDASRVSLGEDEAIATTLAYKLQVADAMQLSQRALDGHRSELARLLNLVNKQLPRLSQFINARYLIHSSESHVLTGDRERPTVANPVE